MSSGLNLDVLVWCGPDTPEGIQEEFDTLYSRPVGLDASIYFTASDEEAYANHKEVASRRGALPRAYLGKGLLASGASRIVLSALNHVIVGESVDC